MLINFNPDSNGLNKTIQEMMNESCYIISISNLRPICDLLSTISQIIVYYVMQYHDTIFNILLALNILICVFYPLFHFVIVKSNYNNLLNEKISLYHALTNLPKNSVSQAIDSLKLATNFHHSSHFSVSENNSQSLEFNKQEENLLKILLIASENSSTSQKFELIYIIISCFYVLLHIAATTVICMLYRDILNQIADIMIPLDYFFGSASYQVGYLGSFMEFAFFTYGATIKN
jgi:hypothetical protein